MFACRRCMETLGFRERTPTPTSPLRLHRLNPMDLQAANTMAFTPLLTSNAFRMIASLRSGGSSPSNLSKRAATLWVWPEVTTQQPQCAYDCDTAAMVVIDRLEGASKAVLPLSFATPYMKVETSSIAFVCLGAERAVLTAISTSWSIVSG